jgi:hypothetical protein
MNNQDTMSISTDVTRPDQFFNWDHTDENPSSVSDFEYHMSHWVESNNPGAQAMIYLKRSSIPNVYVIEAAVEMERSSLFCAVKGGVKISFLVINGKAATDGYEEYVMKLGGADLSRLDEITI